MVAGVVPRAPGHDGKRHFTISKGNRWLEAQGWRLHVNLERVKGIEPSSQAWEARILPLNHTRITESL